MEIDKNKCQWLTVLTDHERKTYDNGIVWSVSMAAITGFITNIIILQVSTMKEDWNYLNLSIFMCISFFRRFIYFLHLLLNFNFEWEPNFQGFYTAFSSVLEYEYLTHACVERYVTSKFIINGWPRGRGYYKLFCLLSVLFATAYAVFPLIGLGSYGLDFDCETYNFSMILPSDWTEYFVMTLFWLRTVKPAGFMFWMLGHCVLNQMKYMATLENAKQKKITKTVAAVTLVTLLCYLPMFLLRGKVLWTQLIRSKIVIPAAQHIMWASWLYWIQPVLATLALFAIDSEFYDAVVHKCFAKLIPSCMKPKNAMPVSEDQNLKED